MRHPEQNTGLGQHLCLVCNKTAETNFIVSSSTAPRQTSLVWNNEHLFTEKVSATHETPRKIVVVFISSRPPPPPPTFLFRTEHWLNCAISSFARRLSNFAFSIFGSFRNFFALCFVASTENKVVWRVWSLVTLVRVMEKHRAQNRTNGEVNKSPSYTVANTERRRKRTLI